MAESACCQRLRNGIEAIRIELKELMETLSNGEINGRDVHQSIKPCDGDKEDFFNQIIQGDQLPDRDELHRQVVLMITDLGYASTLVLQQRLELNYRQATALLAELERDGLV